MSDPAPEGSPREAALLRRLSEVRGGVLALITLVSASVTLLFLLVPSLRPDPRDQVGATIRVSAVEPCVRLSDWAARQYPDDAGSRLRDLIGEEHPSASETAVYGEVLYVELQTNGFKRRKVRLRARLYDPATGRALPVDPDNFHGRTSSVKVDAPSRHSVQLLYLLDLVPERTIFVRVELYDGQGVLATADSPVIRHGVAVGDGRTTSASARSAIGRDCSSAA